MSDDRAKVTEQSNRITFMMMDLIGENYPGIEFSVGPNSAHDRITATIGRSVPIEFGPDEWALNDGSLRGVIAAKIASVFRANLPH
jgi:hypothetical protein